MKFGENCEMAGPRVLDHSTWELEPAYRNSPNSDPHFALGFYGGASHCLLTT